MAFTREDLSDKGITELKGIATEVGITDTSQFKSENKGDLVVAILKRQAELAKSSKEANIEMQEKGEVTVPTTGKIIIKLPIGTWYKKATLKKAKNITIDAKQWKSYKHVAEYVGEAK